MKEIDINGEKLKVVSTVDAVGLFCPLPIVKLKKEIDKVELKQIVELLADDPGVQEDLVEWCKLTDNKLISIKKNEEDIFVAYVQKK